MSIYASFSFFHITGGLQRAFSWALVLAGGFADLAISQVFMDFAD
jgi:hypothetical protein